MFQKMKALGDDVTSVSVSLLEARVMFTHSSKILPTNRNVDCMILDFIGLAILI